MGLLYQKNKKSKSPFFKCLTEINKHDYENLPYFKNICVFLQKQEAQLRSMKKDKSLCWFSIISDWKYYNRKFISTNTLVIKILPYLLWLKMKIGVFLDFLSILNSYLYNLWKVEVISNFISFNVTFVLQTKVIVLPVGRRKKRVSVSYDYFYIIYGNLETPPFIL